MAALPAEKDKVAPTPWLVKLETPFIASQPPEQLVVALNRPLEVEPEMVTLWNEELPFENDRATGFGLAERDPPPPEPFTFMVTFTVREVPTLGVIVMVP